jgi:hypothetical protein
LTIYGICGDDKADPTYTAKDTMMHVTVIIVPVKIKLRVRLSFLIDSLNASGKIINQEVPSIIDGKTKNAR